MDVSHGLQQLVSGMTSVLKRVLIGFFALTFLLLGSGCASVNLAQDPRPNVQYELTQKHSSEARGAAER
jgi:hypothetical protein